VLVGSFGGAADTTELNFIGQAIAGLGTLRDEAQPGMHMHSSLVVTHLRHCPRDQCAPRVRSMDWGLLTSRTTETLETSTELIDWYRAR
jgi:hypothetical protein